MYRCDGCDDFPLQRVRHHCMVCADFDLCPQCYEVFHGPNSQFQGGNAGMLRNHSQFKGGNVALLRAHSTSHGMVVLQIPSTKAQTDRDALLALYHATGGPEWENNDKWDTEADVSLWHGVTVKTGHVVKLDLADNNLRGPARCAYNNAVLESYSTPNYCVS